MSTRLVVAGGGTGGHLFPGVAVAEEVLRSAAGSEVLFVGTERGLESRVLPKLGYRLECIQITGIKTVGVLGALTGLARIPGATWQSRKILRDFGATCVVGVGGYASGPAVLAAKLANLPCAILEQNSVPGMTNRYLGKFADRAFLSFSHSEKYFRKSIRRRVGNPVRRAIVDTLHERAGAEGALRLLVLGGSQGAVAVNQMVVAALQRLQVPLHVTHQCGERGLQETREGYRSAGIEANCVAFIDDIAHAYARADLVVARAGATTLAELGIAGVPAILVPYPHAAEDHQRFNAEEFAGAGAALVCAQGTGAAARLAEMLERLCLDAELRRAMGGKMRAQGRPNAASEVAKWIFSRG